MSIVLEFKCRPKDGVIKRPELMPWHVVEGGRFNELQLNMLLRRIFKSHPELKLPRTFLADELPSFVSIDDSEFMATVRINYRDYLAGVTA